VALAASRLKHRGKRKREQGPAWARLKEEEGGSPDGHSARRGMSSGEWMPVRRATEEDGGEADKWARGI
jgi:hypothetical protein